MSGREELRRGNSWQHDLAAYIDAVLREEVSDGRIAPSEVPGVRREMLRCAGVEERPLRLHVVQGADHVAR